MSLITSTKRTLNQNFMLTQNICTRTTHAILGRGSVIYNTFGNMDKQPRTTLAIYFFFHYIFCGEVQGENGTREKYASNKANKLPTNKQR